MHSLTYRFTASLWIYQGKGAWHFLTLPTEAADEIRFFNAAAKGFMPISVTATIGKTTWKTSLFPDAKSGSYLLAVKVGVRKVENLVPGQSVTVALHVKSEI